jgi:transposase
MINLYDLNLETVVYDATNFFSYINTTTDSELAHRGHNKQKRDDLRQVSLALMSTTDFLVPLFYELYHGNTLDHQEFESLTERLAERYQMLAKECKQITLVLDKGNIKKKTIKDLKNSDYGFVCSLSPANHKDLIKIPETEFKPLSSEYTGERSYRTNYKAFDDVKGTAIVLDNEELRLGQLQSIIIKSRKISQAIKRIQKKLDRRRRGLVTKGRKPTINSITKQVNELLTGKYIKQIVNYEVKEKEGIPSVSYTIDHDKLNNIIRKKLGKTWGSPQRYHLHQ